ncbi:hypothetical protein [Shewanella waksmanii]|uniref:hypothetical protein n=1 Tax=Shewanella waksmanii TaxID=213783 RepID=UPI003735D7A1
MISSSLKLSGLFSLFLIPSIVTAQPLPGSNIKLITPKQCLITPVELCYQVIAANIGLSTSDFKAGIERINRLFKHPSESQLPALHTLDEMQDYMGYVSNQSLPPEEVKTALLKRMNVHFAQMANEAEVDVGYIHHYLNYRHLPDLLKSTAQQ